MKYVPSSWSSLKSILDKLGVDKIVPFLVDLSKLSDIVKNDVFKKDVYNAKIKLLKIKYLILLNWLLILFLMLK